jgi:hypothetical protein
MDDKKLVDELKTCHETVEHLEEEREELREENRHLRQAAGVFGQLAERLNLTLREERRQREDRRRTPRATPDRRGSSGPAENNHSNNTDW